MGIDSEPTSGSENLVKSGGVKEAIKKELPKNIVEEGFYITNETGKAILRLDVLDSKNGFGENLVNAVNQLITNGTAQLVSSVGELELGVGALGTEVASLEKSMKESVKESVTEENGIYICDEEGHALIRLDVLDTKGGIGPNLQKSFEEINAMQDVFQEGFYICNEDGSVVGKYVDGAWVFYTDYKSGFYRRTGDVASGDTWVLSNNSVKNDKRLVFSGTIDTFGIITVGHGVTGQWNASWLVVDDTNLTVYNWNGSQTSDVYVHGLAIQHNIQIEIVKSVGANATIKIVSDGEVFSQEAEWLGSNGNIYVTSTSALTNCVLSWSCSKLDGGMWIFGDSYLTVSAADRWPYYLIQDNFLNWLQDGHSGAKSMDGLSELRNLLHIGTPRTIIWCLGMNDGDSDGKVNPNWNTAYKEVVNICKDKNIELILATIPNASSTTSTEGGSATTVINDYKNAIVTASGYRYIDFSVAVGADSQGNWWAGMKNQNDVHPTAKGAKSLYQRAICDAPELMK